MRTKFLLSGVVMALLLSSSTNLVGAQSYSQRNNVKEREKMRVQSTTEPRKTPPGREVSCEAILRNTKARSESLVEMSRNMLTKFDAILASVENYYTGTIIPSGKTVPNYQSLINDTKAKKAAVESALNVVTEDLKTLSCENDNPKEAILKFNSDMKAVKSALANYRTSIKNVIKAVRGFKRPTDKPRGTFLPPQTAKPRPDGTVKPFSPRPERQINPPSI